MASAFAYAGCENTLLSLWKVADQVSLSLMDNFYAEILKGEPTDVALSRTKRHYLEQGDELSTDPKIWAPMVAYGSQSKVIDENGKNWIVYAALLSLALAILFFSYKKLRKRTT
jgi:hypothetical protein